MSRIGRKVNLSCFLGEGQALGSPNGTGGALGCKCSLVPLCSLLTPSDCCWNTRTLPMRRRNTAPAEKVRCHGWRSHPGLPWPVECETDTCNVHCLLQSWQGTCVEIRTGAGEGYRSSWVCINALEITLGERGALLSLGLGNALRSMLNSVKVSRSFNSTE